MTSADFDTPPVVRSSTGKNVLFALLGIAVVVGGAVITLGGSLAGAASILVVTFILRRRNRQITRMGAWVASVGGTIAGTALLFVFGFVMASGEPEKNMTPAEKAEARAKARAEVAESQAKARERMPAWIRERAPQSAAQQAAADSMAARLLENKGAMVWIGTVGAMFGATLLGAFAGTIGWGGVMLLYRSVRGDWLRSRAIEPPRTIVV